MALNQESVRGRRAVEDGRRDGWRGRLIEDDVDDVTADAATLLRRQSRVLLGRLLAPHRRDLGLAALFIVLKTGGALVIPYLVGLAIDRGLAHGDIRTLLVIAGLVAVAACTSAVGN